jgi:hypothetical protein
MVSPPSRALVARGRRRPRPTIPLSVWTAIVLLVSHGPLTGQSAGDPWRTDFTRHTVPLEEIVSGGPPKDGIPALDRPRFQSVREARRWLSDQEPVAVVRIAGEVKAYPLQILIWHEIVNDEVGGAPVTVTFCPLCNTTLAFERAFDGRILDFGTTGRLRHSDMVMYDRQTESWWQQATGEGIVGEYAGEKLAFVPAPVLSWREVRTRLPEARVLSRDTGHERPYGRNPYEGYDRRRGPIASFFQGPRDDRLPAMERVVALEAGGQPLAIPFSVMEERKVMALTLDGDPVVVFWSPGTASAVDAGQMATGRDVGSTAVFSSVLEGRHLTFGAGGDGTFRDRETGSTWTLAGDAVAGPLKGRSLEPLPHGNHFWFAWAAFKPETRIIRGG